MNRELTTQEKTIIKKCTYANTALGQLVRKGFEESKRREYISQLMDLNLKALQGLLNDLSIVQ